MRTRRRTRGNPIRAAGSSHRKACDQRVHFGNTLQRPSSAHATKYEASGFMNQSVDERPQSSVPEEPKASARVLPFERPPSDLQRAIQQRAQESLERSRERAKTKPAPLKWTLTFLLALVPVLLLVLGIDAFVRV